MVCAFLYLFIQFLPNVYESPKNPLVQGWFSNLLLAQVSISCGSIGRPCDSKHIDKHVEPQEGPTCFSWGIRAAAPEEALLRGCRWTNEFSCKWRQTGRQKSKAPQSGEVPNWGCKRYKSKVDGQRRPVCQRKQEKGMDSSVNGIWTEKIQVSCPPVCWCIY